MAVSETNPCHIPAGFSLLLIAKELRRKIRSGGANESDKKREEIKIDPEGHMNGFLLSGAFLGFSARGIFVL